MTRPVLSWVGIGVLLAAGCTRHSHSTAKSTKVHALASAAAKKPAAKATAAAYVKPLIVPHTGVPIHLDGRASESDWRHALRTGPFKNPKDGTVGRPYSEARFVWNKKNLYVLFYAGDDDIHATVRKHDAPLYLQDAFSLKIRPEGGPVYDIDFAANGTDSDARELPGGKLDPKWESHAVVGVSRDGTLNNTHDLDEEWLVETAIPFASLGMHARPGLRFSVRIERCDKPLHGVRGCGVFARGHGGKNLVTLELGKSVAR